MKKIVALVLSLVMVLGLATTAFADTTAAEYDLYKADTAVGTLESEDVAYTTYAPVKNEDGSGTLEWLNIAGNGYVKIDKADATINDYYVTKANDKTPLFYLTRIAGGAVDYVCTAVEFTNIGVKCDQLNAAYTDYVTNEVEFYVHTNALGVKTYYASDAIVATAPYYNGVSTATTTTNILVGDEVVAAYKFNDSPLNTHVWAPAGYDKTTPVSALCGICGAKANLYTAAKTPANSLVVGTLTVGNDVYNIVPAAASTPSVDGDKVESAETFDAGIAMYVGMSVMAAAGSAVVLKKKD